MNSHWENEGLNGYIRAGRECLRKNKSHEMTQREKNTNG
jgi:hypothetical protein